MDGAASELVERLADTQAHDIKRWLVREGYRNTIMYEYLAYTCATAGALAEELAPPMALDPRRRRFAVANGDTITVVHL